MDILFYIIYCNINVYLCRVAALGLFAGVVLVLLLFCLYRVLCPRNYGQNGVPHGRRRRGDLPCDEYGYSPPISEISPLLLRGHSMVRIKLTCTDAFHKCTLRYIKLPWHLFPGHWVSGQWWHAAGQLLSGGTDPCVGCTDRDCLTVIPSNG